MRRPLLRWWPLVTAKVAGGLPVSGCDGRGVDDRRSRHRVDQMASEPSRCAGRRARLLFAGRPVDVCARVGARRPIGRPSVAAPALRLVAGASGYRRPARAVALRDARPLCASRLPQGSRSATLTRGAGHSAAALAIVACAGAVVDGFMEPVPIAIPPPRMALDQAPADAMVIEIPVDDPPVSAGAMYRSIDHRRPLLNGYSGHTPPHYAILGLALRRGDTSVLTSLARRTPLAIVVNPAADPDGELPQDDRGDARRQHAQDVSAAGPSFLLSRQPAPAPTGDGASALRRASPRRSARVDWIAVNRERSPAIGFPLRCALSQPRRALLVEASDDGVEWKRGVARLDRRVRARGSANRPARRTRANSAPGDASPLLPHRSGADAWLAGELYVTIKPE